MAITEEEYFSRTAKYIGRVSKMTDCDFCGDYLCQRYADRQRAKLRDNPKITSGYTLSLVSTRYRNGKKAGIYTQGGYPIRYCPMCGKELGRKRRTGAERQNGGSAERTQNDAVGDPERHLPDHPTKTTPVDQVSSKST